MVINRSNTKPALLCLKNNGLNHLIQNDCYSVNSKEIDSSGTPCKSIDQV